MNNHAETICDKYNKFVHNSNCNKCFELIPVEAGIASTGIAQKAHKAAI